MSEKSKEEINFLLDAYVSAYDSDLESIFSYWTTENLKQALTELKEKTKDRNEMLHIVKMIKQELKRRK